MLLTRHNVQGLPDKIRPPKSHFSADPAIVHLGVGGFHRSHMELYLQELIAKGGDDRWTVHGVGVLPNDRGIVDDLRNQDCLYSLNEKSPDGRNAFRIIGTMRSISWLPNSAECAQIIRVMSSPSIAIVSLTITEGGYPVDSESLQFLPDHPSVADDRNGVWYDSPSTAFGLILSALQRRFDSGLKPFTVLSCDNIRHNGIVAKASVLGFAKRESSGLVDWIVSDGAFPSSMVDRITPATTDGDCLEAATFMGLSDRRPVVSEDFRQWVLQDHFACGRPSFEDVGVQVVNDVEPYEVMKLRLLNAGHQLIGHVGRLAGLTYSHEAIAHPTVRACFESFMSMEVVPTLPPVPGEDLLLYQRSLIRRFGNSAIADRLSRLCADASDRIPKFLFGTILDNLHSGGPITLSMLTLAAWSQGLSLSLYPDIGFDVADTMGESLKLAAQSDAASPGDFLEHPLLAPLRKYERVFEEYRAIRAMLSSTGILEAAQQCLR